MDPSARDFCMICPRCHGQNTTSNGWSPARRALCRKDTIWLLTKNYKCGDCGKKKSEGDAAAVEGFTATDPNALACLPQHIAQLFPFMTTGSAKNSWFVETAIVMDMITMRDNGMSWSAMHSLICEGHEAEYMNQATRYYWALDYAFRPRQGTLTTSATLSPPPNKTPFPKPFDCPAIKVCATASLKDLVRQVYRARRPLHWRLIQLTDGEILSGDASHKLTAMVNIKPGTRCFHGYVWGVVVDHAQMRARPHHPSPTKSTMSHVVRSTCSHDLFNVQIVYGVERTPSSRGLVVDQHRLNV